MLHCKIFFILNLPNQGHIVEELDSQVCQVLARLGVRLGGNHGGLENFYGHVKCMQQICGDKAVNVKNHPP